MPSSPNPKAWLSRQNISRPDWTNSSQRPPDRLWLDKNENLDPHLLEVTSRVAAEVAREGRGLFTYPETGALYQKLAEHVGVSPRHLRLTPGSDGAIRSVFEAYVEPQHTVVHTAPSFAMYAVYCKMFGAHAVPVEYERTDTGPRLPFDAFLAAVERHSPRLVCLPNPDSPTGTVVAFDEIVRLLEVASKVGAIVLVDEAYYPFYADSVVRLVDRHPHLVVARTFAKAWGLAGLRIGYAVAHPDVAFALHQVRPMYEVNTFACEVVERMLHHEEAVRASVRRTLEGKQHFERCMNTLGFQTLESHGNFTHVAFGGRAQAVHDALGTRVLYRKGFSERCLEGYSRFSIAPTPTMEEVALLIESALKEVRP